MTAARLGLCCPRTFKSLAPAACPERLMVACRLRTRRIKLERSPRVGVNRAFRAGMRNSHSSNPLAGAAAGAIGGLLGSWMIVRFNRMLGQNGASEEDRRRPHMDHRARAQPNDSDGTIADEPASRRAASALVETVTGQPLSDEGKDVGGPVVHYLFGAIAGALYGAAAETQPQTAMGMGMPFGATVWVAADEMGLPLLGLSEPPTEVPLSRHASALATHLVYGLTVETVRRLFRGMPQEA